MNAVLSWGQALELGHEPRDYSYEKEDVPIGTYTAVLDFKVWAKNAAGINCYFTKADTREKMLLTVYRRRSDQKYVLGDVDFRAIDTEKGYRIEVGLNKNGNIKLMDIET